MPVIENQIPTAELRDLFPGFNPLGASLVLAAGTIAEFSSLELPMLYAYEQMVLAAIVRDVEPVCLLEFGTGQGTGTLVLAANAPAAAIVHTVDLDPAARGEYTAKILRTHSDVGAAYKASAWAGKVRQILVRPNEPVASFANLAGQVDLAFIDGDHTYNGVRVDTEIALSVVKPSATFVWHDFYDFPGYIAEGKSRRGVFPWLNELAETGRLSLYHVAGTYMVVGRTSWGRDIPSRIRQPGDRGEPFANRIARQGEA